MRKITSIGLTAAFIIALAGCEGPQGPAGAQGPAGPAGADGTNGTDGTNGQPGVSTGMMTGTITNSATTNAIAGATIDLTPAVVAQATTGADGTFSVDGIPAGVYSVTIAADGYASFTGSVSIIAGASATLDEALAPTADVTVNASADNAAVDPGATVNLSASADIMDGSTVETYAWTQVSGPEVEITNADQADASFTMPEAEALKAILAEAAYQPDRTEILPVNPHSQEEAETAVFQVKITTSSGTYTGTVTVTANLGVAWATGIANVPLNLPVVFQAASAGSYTSSVKESPAGSTAALDDAASRWPILTPDVAGKYVVTVNGTDITFYSAKYSDGVITGVDADGNPTYADSSCVQCHNGTMAFNDKFQEWAKSGHAEIFTQNMDDPHNHWSLSCAPCHTVGYDGNDANGGFDAAVTAAGWTPPKSIGAGTYAQILQDDPAVGHLANIQCENCHGPNGQNGAHHVTGSEPNEYRMNLGADMCIRCHGEPPRHGRGQEWENSGHANWSLALQRGTNSGCAQCHSAEGFVQYAEGETIVAADANHVHPITCTACHDPHNPGSVSSEPNDVNLRISGTTGMLNSGFVAHDVGRGALCMSCHNARYAFEEERAVDNYDMPHHGPQADVLMGESAYFVTLGKRAAHSYIENTCTACHMELTPPPAEWSLNGGGTNHDFKASLSICSDCHGAFDGQGVQNALGGAIQDLGDYIAQSGFEAMQATAASAGLKLAGTVTPANDLASVSLSSSHGKVFHIVLADGSAVDLPLTQVTDNNDNILWTGNSNLVKALWNYELLVSDASSGVHNPSFVRDVVNASIAQDLGPDGLN